MWKNKQNYRHQHQHTPTNGYVHRNRPQHNYTRGNTETNNHESVTQYANIITELQPFFLTKQMVVKKSKAISPKQKDTLFWCFFILKQGHSSYEQLFNNDTISYVKEKQLKIQLVEELRDNSIRSKLKQIKLVSIDHIENQLANETTIDLATFFSLCYINNIQIFYFKNKCYYTSLPETYTWMNTTQQDVDNSFESIYKPNGSVEDEDGDDFDFETIFILKQTNGKYWMDEINVSDIDWETCYRIKNIAKPINAISAYTAAQIKEMASMFGIEVSGKKKQEIYDQLKSFIKIDIR